jgi:hypothetical protein
MPIDESTMSNDVLKMFRNNMKLLDPNATPQEFQEELVKAVVKGTVTVLKATVLIGVPSPAVAPPPADKGVGLIVNGALMATTATTTMMGLSGGGGVALQGMMNAMFLPMSIHLATNAEIYSISGFGGIPLPPFGAVAPLFQAAVFAALSPKTQTNLLKSSSGMFMIQSIAAGLGAGMSIAIPGPIPFTPGPTVGPLVAMIK